MKDKKRVLEKYKLGNIIVRRVQRNIIVLLDINYKV